MMSMSSISISSSTIRAFSSKLVHVFPSSSSSFKPLLSSSSSSFFLPCSLKSITFQTLPTKPQSSSSSSSSSSPVEVEQPIEELPPKLQEIIKLFQAVEDPRAKYQQLMFYANNMPPLDPQYKTKDNKVEGCVSQVWVRAYLDDDHLVHYEADSDSIMTKGLASLLVLGLSAQPISHILKVTPHFVTLLGLHHNLTPSRNNGFLNMLKLMQRKALFLGLDSHNKTTTTTTTSSQSESHQSFNLEENEPEKISDPDEGTTPTLTQENVSSSNGLGLGPRGERIRQVLERELKPVELDIEDVSYQHAGHMGSNGSDAETHFNLKIVSPEFEGKSSVKRHRMIYALLQDELQSGLHALSITANTPSQVQEPR